MSLADCADVHNRLLQRRIEHIPHASSSDIQRNLASQFLQASDWDESDVADLPVYQFFSQIDLYMPGSSGVESTSIVDWDGSLTPTVRQPHVDSFFKYDDWIVQDDTEEYEYVVLLYESTSDEDGGLFFDLVDGLAHWHYFPGPLPPKSRWVPLLSVLVRWMGMWDIGKFYWDSEQDALAIRPFVETDVAQSLAMWHTLIHEIHLRLPGNNNSDEDSAQTLLPPLDTSLLNQYSISAFAISFLSQARLPASFKYVAPGTTFFTPQYFASLYGSEPADSRRLRWIAGQDPASHHHPTLLLPTQPVPASCDDSNFDRDWGYAKFTVQRLGGLYLDPCFSDEDAVAFISDEGTHSAFQFQSVCPWGPGRPPRLEEVLRKWIKLVRDGTWAVDENGVCDGVSWVGVHREQTLLEWTDETR